MRLDYVFGPIIAVEPSLLNTNIQVFQVYDRQEKQHGWAWTHDDYELQGECTDGGYDIDPFVVIDDLLKTLKEHLEDGVIVWQEEHPKESK